MSISIHTPDTEADRAWLADLWRREWGGEVMITRGQTHYLHQMEALIAWEGELPVGAATYRPDPAGWELMSLNALTEGKGVGSALLGAFEDAARAAGAGRVWLITTNDNLDALRFYQRRGYRMAAIYPGAVDEARQQKDSIPLVGYHGIPLHDELELEKTLA